MTRRPSAKKSYRGRPRAVVPRLRRVNGDDLQDSAFNELRNALTSGKFEPGQRTPIRALASHMGTSVMPVREAVRRLIALRALEILPNRSIAVPVMTPERLKDILPARLALESKATRRATSQLGGKEIRTLRETLQEMRKLNKKTGRKHDARAYLELNARFHFTIYAACGSQTIVHLIETLWSQIGPYMHVLHEESSRWSGDDTHAEILEAIEARDPWAASQAIQRDIGEATEHAIKMLTARNATATA